MAVDLNDDSVLEELFAPLLFCEVGQQGGAQIGIISHVGDFLLDGYFQPLQAPLEAVWKSFSHSRSVNLT